ncbi:hypothetical protein TIFTF001_048402 [Ficus carica]|uniref:Uncharacterized protein n=1 Tax=Ficus carica TaxID=3494 RepID=A0AA88CYS7_FICCA|nr:hypothetical protein TIFTF001_048402 [Ficus carica]
MFQAFLGPTSACREWARAIPRGLNAGRREEHRPQTRAPATAQMLDGMGAQPTRALTRADGHRRRGKGIGHRTQACIRQSKRRESRNSNPSWGWLLYEGSWGSSN